MVALNNSQKQTTSQIANNEHTTELLIKGQTYRFTVTRDSSKYEPARAKIRTELAKRFNGWSDDHDRQFDSSAYFFLLHDSHGQLCAASRMIVSDSNGTVVPVSQTNRCCQIDFGGALEYSGLWFDSFANCLALTGLGGDWVAEHFGARDIYAIFEASNPVIRRIYLRSIGMDKVEHPLIAYDGFVSKEDGRPVEWQLAVCQAESRKSRAMQLLASVGAELISQDKLVA